VRVLVAGGDDFAVNDGLVPVVARSRSFYSGQPQPQGWDEELAPTSLGRSPTRVARWKEISGARSRCPPAT